MFGIGAPELIIILLIVLVVFGGSKLPELSRNIGTAIKELRKGMSESTDDSKKKNS